jgi:uncharacterized membrane protein
MARDMGFGPFDAAFSPEDRKLLRRQVIARIGDFRSMRQQMQTDLAAILTALRADPYDPAATAAAFDAQAAHVTDRLVLGTAVVRDYLAALPQPSRLAFADRLEHAMQHGPGRGDKHPDDKP